MITTPPNRNFLNRQRNFFNRQGNFRGRGTAGTAKSETEIIIQFAYLPRKMKAQFFGRLRRYVTKLRTCEKRAVLGMPWDEHDGLAGNYHRRWLARVVQMEATQQAWSVAATNILPRELVRKISSYLGEVLCCPRWWDKEVELAAREELHRQYGGLGWSRPITILEALENRKTRRAAKRKVIEIVDLTQD